jgi:hypothetical protein
MTFGIQANSMVTLDMEVAAAGITEWTASSIGSSTTDYTNREPFDSFTGSMLVDGSSECVTGVDVTINNATERNFCLFTRDAGSMTDGIPEITGNVSVYFTDPDDVSNKFYNETESDFVIRMIDPDGNAYVLGINNVKYTGDTIDSGDTLVNESAPFRCEPEDGGYEVTLRRQPAAR